jgi:hypothetical protein
MNKTRSRKQPDLVSDERFGWELQSHKEIDGKVRINCLSSDGQLLVVEAK